MPPYSPVSVPPMGSQPHLIARIMASLSRNSDIHDVVFDQLSLRDEDTIEQWPADVKIRRVVKLVSETIKECLGWPNSNFIPEDPCRLLLWDGTMELGEVRCMRELAQAFPGLAGIFSLNKLQNASFGDLIGMIAANTH